jgi:hypothetical protein
MIVHYNHDKPVSVYVVNSRLPVYRAFYGNGLGDTIAGLFARMAPKVAPLAKQLSMKAIDVLRDKGIGAVGSVASKALSAAKNKIVSLVRRQRQKPTPLPSTTVMPKSVASVINDAVEKKLTSLAAPAALLAASPSSDTTTNTMLNAIAGSGLASKNLKRNLKHFQRKRR